MRVRTVKIAIGVWLAGIPLSVSAEELRSYAALSLQAPYATAIPSAPDTGPRALDRLAGAYSTPKAIANFLKREFTFKRDLDLFGEADHWQSPDEFLAQQAGDCEDYALLAQALLRRHGFDAFIFSVFGEDGYAHTVAVFVDEDGRYDVINQDRLELARVPSLEAIASRLYPAWTFAAIVEQDGSYGQPVQEFFNEHPAATLTHDPAGFSF
jgi:hypothetical protein